MKYGAILLALLASVGQAGASESKLTQWASKTTAKIVSGTKDVLTGVQQGVDTGRQTGASVDGAVVITNQNYHPYVDISVESATTKTGVYELTLVFKNKTDQIVRLTNLYQARNFYLLDNKGFSSALVVGGDTGDVTILKNSATKKTYRFSTQPLSGDVVALRLYETNIALP